MKIHALAHILSQTCHNLSVKAYIGRDPRSRVYVAYETPGGILLPVDLDDGVKVASFVGLIDDLQYALEKIAPTLQIEMIKSPLCVEIKNPSPKVIEMTPELLSSLSLAPFEGVIGINVTPMRSRIFTNQLDDPETAHLLFAGTTGSGKTVAMMGYALSLAWANSPETLKIVLIDPKRRKIPQLGALPHVIAQAYDPKDIGPLVRWVEMTTNERVADTGAVKERLLVIVDETSEVIYLDPTIQASLTSTAKRGRELGVHLAMADQRPLASTVGGDLIQQLSTRVIGRLRTAREASDILGQSDPTLVHLTGSGSMMVFPGGRVPLKVQTFFPTVDALIEAICKKWEGSRVETIQIEEEMPKGKGKFDVEKDAEAIRETVVKFWDSKGHLKRGGLSRCASDLNSDYGGSTITRIAAAIDWLEQKGVVGDRAKS